MNRPILITILVSLFIHLAFLLPLLKHAPEKPLAASQPKNQTVEISLVQPKPEPPQAPKVEPQPEDDTPPPPRHMEDDRTKANTSDGLAEKSGGKSSKASQKGDSEPEPNQASEKEIIASQHESAQAKELKANIGNKDTANQGGEIQNQSKLAEGAKGTNTTKQNINDEQEEKARWHNETLMRIREQISYIWIKPEQISERAKGTIQFKLDSQGYLLTAWIHTPSGNWVLDASILRAVKGVIRYQIPPNQPPNRRNILFNYRGG